MTDPFATFTHDDVATLIARFPLAWVCSTGDRQAEAAQLPLVGEYGDGGRLTSLIGHLARANPLEERLRTGGEALILFSGPSAYVSPEHAGVRDWAPTWNYANLRIRTRVTVDDALTDESLDVLISAMEADRPAPWTRDEIAHRYHRMAGAIVGFRAVVVAIEGRFKFGQDERASVYNSIVDRLPDRDVTDWMRRFNPGR